MASRVEDLPLFMLNPVDLVMPLSHANRPESPLTLADGLGEVIKALTGPRDLAHRLPALKAKGTTAKG